MTDFVCDRLPLIYSIWMNHNPVFTLSCVIIRVLTIIQATSGAGTAYLSSSPVYREVIVAQSLRFRVVLCRSLSVRLCFYVDNCIVGPLTCGFWLPLPLYGVFRRVLSYIKPMTTNKRLQVMQITSNIYAGKVFSVI